MKRYIKYVAGAMVMAGIVAMMACTGEEPTAPAAAPVTEPTARRRHGHARAAHGGGSHAYRMPWTCRPAAVSRP